MPLLCAAVIVPAAAAAQADVAAFDDSVSARLRRGGERHEMRRAVLWIERGALDSAAVAEFARLADRGVDELERSLGRRLDRAHYGEAKVHYFVSDSVAESHVYGGYEHARYRRPYVYLSARRVRRRRAPYLHETTHLLARGAGSLSLREGLAQYAEATVAERGGGYTPHLFDREGNAGIDRQAGELLASPAGQGVLPWIGTDAAPRGGAGGVPRFLSDSAARAAFHVLSYSYTKFLVERVGLRTFLAIYAAANVDAALRESTGRESTEWKRAWLAAIER